MFDEKTKLKVGGVFCLLVLIALGISLRLNYRELGPSVRVFIFMKSPGPLHAHARVQLAGRKIGEVDSIRLVSSQEARNEQHPLFPDGGVVLSIRIRHSFKKWVPKNSEFFINAKGIIGESYLEIAPPQATQAIAPPIEMGDKIRGKDPARIEEIIVVNFMNAKRLASLLKDLAPSIHQIKTETKALIATMEAFKKSKPLGEANSLPRTPSLLSLKNQTTKFLDILPSKTSLLLLFTRAAQITTHAKKNLTAVRETLEALNKGITRVQKLLPIGIESKFLVAVHQARSSLQQTAESLRVIEDLIQNVERGQGSLGALINDPEFSDDAKSLGKYLKRHPWQFLTKPLK